MGRAENKKEGERKRCEKEGRTRKSALQTGQNANGKRTKSSIELMMASDAKKRQNKGERAGECVVRMKVE
jgi:hypothetical protein